MRRERIFLAVALLIPVALFGAIELTARLLWREGASPLFVAAPVAQGRYLVANPTIAARWFPLEERPPGPSAELMLRQKPARGFRLFVLGESAAQGFPYPRTGAFSRALAAMLRDALPGDTVEVINLGIAATNSFAMLDVQRDLLHYAPDAIVYYGGHNEYYGALGAGSSVRLPGSDGVARFYLTLQRLRSVRLASHLLAQVRRRGAPARDAAEEANFMGVVARDRAIAFDGPVYAQGVKQYEANLVRLVRRFRRAGVPVYLASVASNERDQPPFASPVNVAADSAFARAEALLLAGDSAAARVEFGRARDLDVIRFRAPGVFVEVAKRVAAAEAATYVPVAEAFAAASPNGVPGASLFLEHVHVNAAGSWLIAQTVMDAMRDAPPPGRSLDAALLAAPEVYQEGRALSALDERIAMHRLRALTVRWPFVPADRQGDYFGSYRPDNLMDSLAFAVAAGGVPWEVAKLDLARREVAAGRLEAGLLEYRGLMLDSPQFPLPWREAGEALVSANRSSEADAFLAEAFRLEPTVALARYRAQLAGSERRWRDAAGAWQYIVGRAPADAEGWYRWSLASALAGDSVTARAAAQRLARIAPNHPAYREWVRLLFSAPR